MFYSLCMLRIEETDRVMDTVASRPAVLLLFGGVTCGVCTAIKPKIERMLAERFTQIDALYIDCVAHPDFSAQQGVHTLPVVRVYFDGQPHVERVRAFGIEQLAEDIARPYGMLFAGQQ